MINEIFTKSILIFGCGNTLFGDDGFGPEVIDHLHANYVLPVDVLAEDVGTGIGDLLFDLTLSPSKPTRIFIIDAVSSPGRKPGEVFEMEVAQLPVNKAGDFCLHQFPSVNLLKELEESCGVKVRILAVQIQNIPDSVCPGLSEQVARAVPVACEWLLDEITENTAPVERKSFGGGKKTGSVLGNLSE